MNRKYAASLSFLFALNACVETPPSAYQIRSAESLLVSASDIVTIDLASDDYPERLSDILAHNPPNRAILNCPVSEMACKKTAKLLKKYKIMIELAAGSNSVTLLYDRIAARDCDQRYVDNSQNERNLNYESFGCSIAGNTVQMVTDKHQFTNPDLLDYMDGDKAASVYDNYANPPAAASGSSSGASGTTSLIPNSSGGQ